MNNPNIKFLKEFLSVNAKTLWLFLSNRKARAVIVSEWNHERHMVEHGRPMVDAAIADVFGKAKRKPRRGARR